MAINTVGMVALFAATSANRLSLQVGVVRTRGGYTNTIFSAPIVIHRSVIDPDTAVPTPSILGTGVAAALQVAINTALGFVRLDASARLPAVDGSQLTNLPNTGGVTSITGTANEITVTGTTTPTLSLPSSLTFTGKTVTGGTFTGGAFNGTVGATTLSTIAGTTGAFVSTVTVGANSQAGTLNIKNSSGTTTASISGADGSASFGSGYCTIDASGNLVTSTVNVLAGNMWLGSAAYGIAGTLNVVNSIGTTKASINGSDGSATFGSVYIDQDGDISCGSVNSGSGLSVQNNAITLGTNEGSAAWINNDGSARLESIELGHATDTTLARVSAGVVSIEGATILVNGGDAGTPSAIVLTNASGTASIDINGTVGATTPTTGSFTTLTASATTSLLLGTAGSAVGNIGFRNATSGTTTLAPATGALGTGTVTLPLSGTLATLEGSNTYTGTTNTFTLPTTTGTTTASGIAVAANSLTTGTGIYAASSSLTSGKLMDLQVSGTAAAASQTALNVATAGANGTSGITSKGAVISNTHTGTTSTNVALELTASGGTTNTALNVTAGAIVLQQSPTKYTTVTPGALGGLVFTLTTDGSNLDANYGITVPGRLTVAGNNGYGAAILASGNIQTTSAIQGGSIGWYNNGNVGFSFSGTTVSTGSATTVLSVGATTQSTTTTTGAIVTAGGLGVVKNANIGGTLAVTGASTLTGLLTANGGITLGDAQNIALNTTTGTKIGAATTQKLSFWDATPIVQPTTAVASATVAHTGGGTNIKTDDTFDGYTIAQVVKALRNAGLLA
jgi:hypothetical protein